MHAPHQLTVKLFFISRCLKGSPRWELLQKPLFSKVLVMLNGLVIVWNDNPPLPIVLLLAAILLLGIVTSRIWLPVLVLKLKLSYDSYCSKDVMGSISSSLLRYWFSYSHANVLWQSGCYFITSNLMFHECTKQIEVDWYFIQDLLVKKQIVTHYVHSNDPLSDILTKTLPHASFQFTPC